MTSFFRALDEPFNSPNGGLSPYKLVSDGSTLPVRHHLDIRSYLSPLEVWVADPDVTFLDNPSWRYQRYMNVILRSGGEKLITSYYTDDLLTEFGADDHYIDIPLRDFPAQGAASFIDISNSYVEFSSSTDFDPAVTDSLLFSNTLHSVSAGGDTYLRFRRSDLVKCDLTDIQAVRFRLFLQPQVALPIAPVAAVGASGVLTGKFDYVVTYVTATGETLPSPVSNVVSLSGQRATVTIPVSPSPYVTGRKLYRRQAISMTYPGLGTLPGSTTYPSGETTSVFRLVSTLTNNTTTSVSDNAVVSGTEAQPPTLDGSATAIFKTQDMRMISILDYSYQVWDIDTKTQRIVRSIPQAGGAEPVTTLPDVYHWTSQPKNVTQYAWFNSGHNPVGSDNELSVILRYVDPLNYVKVRLRARNTQSRLALIEVVGGVETLTETAINTNILTESTPYVLKVTAYGNTVTGTVYNTTGGAFKGTAFGTLAVSNTVSFVGLGYLGFGFIPYNYDFSLDFVSNSAAEYAVFQSKDFRSNRSVSGATIYTQTSPAINLVEGEEYVGLNATLTTLPLAGDPAPSMEVFKLGSVTSGGLITVNPAVIGDGTQIIIRGEIFPVDSIQGAYRARLYTREGIEVWQEDIPITVPNTWSSFSLPVRAELIPWGYRLAIENYGSTIDHTFRVDNLVVEHSTISWQASADNGGNWQKFFDSVNDRYRGIKFDPRGRHLKVRATALASGAWMIGYDLVPQYAQLGHRSNLPFSDNPTYLPPPPGNDTTYDESTYDFGTYG